MIPFLCVLLASGGSVPPIYVDQFGYSADGTKIAVFGDPVRGQNSANRFSPGTKFRVCRVSDDGVAFRGDLKVWQSGATSSLAGDKVWHADFSSLTTPARYYITDVTTGTKSYPFSILAQPYSAAMTAATRMFYYQRSGTPIPAVYGGDWNHTGGHVGPRQDLEAHYSQGGVDQGLPRDVAGGWYDAGDPNKYVPFLELTLFNLLMAQDLNPAAFSDATNIPESGNGVPDLLDEVKWELDWTLKMQDADGSVRNRNGNRSYNSPNGPWSVDTQARFYTGKTTWATAVAAASWAHAMRTMAPYGEKYPGYIKKLRTAALSAWSYLDANPLMKPTNGSDGDQLAAAPAGTDQRGDRRVRVYAAAEFFRTTGDAKFGDYVKKWAQDTDATSENGIHPFAQGYFDPVNYNALTQALYIYAKTPKADAALVTKINDCFKATAEMIRTNQAGADDPYLAFMWGGHYYWGSNQVKGQWARMLLMAADLNVNPSQTAAYRAQIADYYHFIHGRNPLGWCYLSNMGAAGVSRSVMFPYHKWFGSSQPDANGVRPPPAPGFLVGGPNQYFSVSWIAPPFGEPPMKAFKDWDTGWNAARGANENSWEITEPAIYYQSAYILILSTAWPAVRPPLR
jgi:hypothetical protein